MGKGKKIAKKTGKVLLYIIAGLLILLFIAGLLIDPIAKNLLKEQVSKAGEGQYSLVLEDLNISILGGDVELSGIQFKTDTSQAENAPIAFLSADQIFVEDIEWLTYLLDNKLVLERVFLNNTDIRLFASQVEQAEPDTSKNQGPFALEQLDIYPMIKEQVDRIYLKDIGFADISLMLVNRSSQDTLQFGARELDFQSDNILVDADRLFTDSRAFYATAINLKSRDIELERRGNKRMAAEAEMVQFITDEELMSIQTKEVHFIREPLQGNDTLLFVALGEFELRELNLNKVQEQSVAALEEISLDQLRVVNKMPALAASSPSDTATIEPSPGLAELSLGEVLPEFIDSVQVNEFSLTDVSVRQGDSIRIVDADFHAGGILINKQTAFASNRFFYAENAESSIAQLEVSLGDPMIHFALSGFEMNIEDGMGKVSFENIQAKVKEKQEGELWFEAELGALAITGINTKELVKGQLSIDSIGLQSPKLVLNLPETETATAGTEQENGKLTSASLYPFIQPFLDQLYLRKIAIVEADIKLEENDRSTYSLLIPALYLQLRDILIAEGTAYSDSRILHTEDIALRVENISYPMPDSIYAARLGLLRLSTFEKFVEARGFRLGVGSRAAQITDSLEIGMVYNLSNENLRIEGIQFSEMLQQKGIFIKSVKAGGLEAYVYQNGNYTVQAADTINPPGMPQKMLRQLDMPLYLGSFELSPGSVTFEQLTAGADTAGFVEVTDLFATAENVTNLQPILRKDPEITLAAGGKVYGTGAFKTELVIHMLNDSSLVQIKGSVDSLDLTKLNQLAVYTTPVSFSSGELYMMEWRIRADEENATGTLAMMYEDVKLRLAESKSSDTTGIFKDVGSFLINTLALEEDVPTEDPKKPETAEISNERDKDKGFVNYYITSLVDGLKEIVITIF